MKPVQMIDLQSQYIAYKSEYDEAIASVISSSHFINGESVSQLQNSLANYLDIHYVIPCGNGTDALALALLALDLPPKSEVITADFSFIAAAEAIARVGLTPVLADVDLQTYTIDTQSIERMITHKTKAIIPIHLFGQAANMQEIMRIAEKHNLAVIEDNAQGFGADYQINGDRKKLGTIGTLGCTSFFPTKNLACFGDGGAVFTNNENLAQKVRRLANHGADIKYIHKEIGFNSRLDSIQAAIINVNLRHLDEHIQRKQTIAQQYSTILQHKSGIQIPLFQSNSTHTFHQYSIRILANRREEFRQFLAKKEIPTTIYYPSTLHSQQALQSFPHDNCKNADMLVNQIVSIPIHPILNDEQVTFICEVLAEWK